MNLFNSKEKTINLRTTINKGVGTIRSMSNVYHKLILKLTILIYIIYNTYNSYHNGFWLEYLGLGLLLFFIVWTIKRINYNNFIDNRIIKLLIIILKFCFILIAAIFGYGVFILPPLYCSDGSESKNNMNNKLNEGVNMGDGVVNRDSNGVAISGQMSGNVAEETVKGMSDAANSVADAANSVADGFNKLASNVGSLGSFGAAATVASSVVKTLPANVGTVGRIGAGVGTLAVGYASLEGVRQGIKYLEQSKAVQESKFVNSEDGRTPSPENHFSSSSMLEDNVSTPMEGLLGVLLLFSVLGLIIVSYLLYMIFIRYILKDNYNLIVKICLWIFKTSSKESIEIKLNKVIGINTITMSVFYIVTVIYTLFIFGALIYFITAMQNDLDSLCQVHTYLINNRNTPIPLIFLGLGRISIKYTFDGKFIKNFSNVPNNLNSNKEVNSGCRRRPSPLNCVNETITTIDIPHNEYEKYRLDLIYNLPETYKLMYSILMREDYSKIWIWFRYHIITENQIMKIKMIIF